MGILKEDLETNRKEQFSNTENIVVVLKLNKNHTCSKETDI